MKQVTVICQWKDTTRLDLIEMRREVADCVLLAEDLIR
jgi:hypothetical protein